MAEESFMEALTIRKSLATINPQTFLPDVADTLNSLANLFTNTNQLLNAEEAYKESLSIYRTFAETNPQTFLPRFGIDGNEP